MTKTKIDWADMTWNPVTGCLHECKYCYAKKQTKRFEGYDPDISSVDKIRHYGDLYDLTHYPMHRETKKGRLVAAPYPFGFLPTFHRYRLGEPAKLKKPQNIFVCSMADLFGDWVPDEWIADVFEACNAAPWHNYMFLTKHPARFKSLGFPKYPARPSAPWFGFSAANQQQLSDMVLDAQWLPHNTFISLEPLFGPVDLNRIEPTGKDAYLDLLIGKRSWFMGGDTNGKRLRWVIIGAETGNRKGKVIPERRWVQDIVDRCCKAGVPVFLKNSLAEIWGEPLIQEVPW